MKLKQPRLQPGKPLRKTSKLLSHNLVQDRKPLRLPPLTPKAVTLQRQLLIVRSWRRRKLSGAK